MVPWMDNHGRWSFIRLVESGTMSGTVPHSGAFVPIPTHLSLLSELIKSGLVDNKRSGVALKVPSWYYLYGKVV